MIAISASEINLSFGTDIILKDISFAIKKVSEIMDSFPCDKERIMLTGDSAGGQLAAFTAATGTGL